MLQRVGQPRAGNESRDTSHLLELSLWEEHFKEPRRLLLIVGIRWFITGFVLFFTREKRNHAALSPF